MSSIFHSLLRMFGHQRWIPRGRDFVLRRFANPDTQPARRFDVPFFGLRYTGDLSNFIDWAVFFYGAYSRNELLLLRDIAKRLGGPVNFYDVGGNIGQHTLFMSQHADHVFSFEPFPQVREEMSAKLAHARVKNVTIFPFALGDQQQVLPLHVPEGSNLGTGTLTGHLPGNASGRTIQVQVERGDDALRGLPPVSLMKIDVEGFEGAVLKGLSSALQRDRPPILMEVTQLGRDELSSLLYPDHVLFDVAARRGDYVLSPFTERTGEALVLPAELAHWFN